MIQWNIIENFGFIFPQLRATLIVITNTIPTGMHYGWTSPTLPIFQSPNSPLKITELDALWLELDYLLANILTLPLTALSLKKLGPKSTIYISAFISLIPFMLIGFAKNVAFLHCARILAGATSTVPFIVTPIFIAEIASRNIRGALCSLNFQFILFGVFLVYVLVPYCPFFVHLVLGFVLTLVQIVTLPFVPETPFFLIANQKMEEAKVALRKLRIEDDIDPEFIEMVVAIQRQNQNKSKISDLVFKKRHRRPFVIYSILIACQMFTGYMVVITNFHSILLNGEVKILSIELWAVIFSCLTCAGSMICSLTVDIFGRRRIMFVSSILTSLAFFISGGCLHSENFALVVPLALISYTVVFRMGLGTIPSVYSSEIFAENIKTLAMSCGEAVAFLLGIFSVVIFHLTSEAFGLEASFYTYGIVALGAAVYVFFCVPETKGKSLDEIQIMFEAKD